MKYSKLKYLQLLNCFDLNWTNHLQLTSNLHFWAKLLHMKLTSI